ncbi:hypothetical protein ACSBR2_031741 [Camellia fascicularis]
MKSNPSRQSLQTKAPSQSWHYREEEVEKIEHKSISVNGINMPVAETCEGPAVLFLYGFPELCRVGPEFPGT